MWSTICSLFTSPPPPTPPSPTPPPVTILGARFPANGISPSLIPLTTTTDDVAGSTSSYLFHVPDLRPFWAVWQAWKYRDLQRLDL
jgi:hypothetical protein